MANTTKKVTNTADEVVETPVVETIVEAQETKSETKAVTAKKTPTTRTLEKIDPNELIEVQSCTYGELTYISRKTGYQIIWDDFGCTNPVTVGDLIDMRNGQKRFFEEPWIVLLGDRAPIIIDYLQVGKYYKNISKLEDFDEIFNYEPADIPAVVKELSQGTKEIIARRAYALIQDGELDSRKMIEAIESATGFKISE